MDYRYVEYDPLLHGLRDLLARLKALFEHLLLQTDGDVEEALRWLEQIGNRYGMFGERFDIEDFKRWLQDQRDVAPAPDGTLVLTGKGERSLRTSALDAIFSNLRKDAAGDHRVAAEGPGLERLPETRPYAFGDPTSTIATTETLSNAIRRGGIDEVTIEEADLAVHETEHASSCATVLLIDVSHSMVLYGEDRITPAKKVALALTELITTRYPKDALNVVLFGDDAWEVPLDRLPYCGVGPFHTNTRAGLRLARDILRTRRQANRQIFMITDGKPSCLTEPDGEIYKNPFGLDQRVVNKTLEEADACRRHGIPVTTFMLTEDPTLVDFVETFTRTNRGRAYYASPDHLGSFVFVDYIKNRRQARALVGHPTPRPALDAAEEGVEVVDLRHAARVGRPDAGHLLFERGRQQAGNVLARGSEAGEDATVVAVPLRPVGGEPGVADQEREMARAVEDALLGPPRCSEDGGVELGRRAGLVEKEVLVPLLQSRPGQLLAAGRAGLRLVEVELEQTSIGQGIRVAPGVQGNQDLTRPQMPSLGGNAEISDERPTLNES